MSFKSGIYSGWLRHRRYSPKQHYFIYKVFMMYIDLDELDSVLNLSRWWSKSRWALARFKRSDFLGDEVVGLYKSIRTAIQKETGYIQTGPIRMLANLRYFGFNINPIVSYYCFDESENLQFIVAEVTNTPWGQRKCYVLECDPSQKRQRIIFDKDMHVSPFNPMSMQYHWSSNVPASRLSLCIETRLNGEVVVDANLSLNRQEITEKSMNKLIFSYPWMTLKVAFAIYWQALRLWVKGVPFYGNPS